MYQRWGQVTHVQVSSPYQQVSNKSQVTVQTNQAIQVKSVALLKQVKSSSDKGQVTVSNRNIYFCHTTLFIFPQKLTFLIIHFK